MKGPRVTSTESAGSWGLRTICLQVVSPREAYTRYTGGVKYRTEGWVGDEGATEREQKRDDRGMIDVVGSICRWRLNGDFARLVDAGTTQPPA